MTRNEGEAEDVTGLFRKFGGDAKAYREFEPAAEPEAGRQVAWALVPGGKPAVEGAQPAPAVPAAASPASPAFSAPAATAAAIAAPLVSAPKAAPPAAAPALLRKEATVVAVPFPAMSKPAAVAMPTATPAPGAASIPADSLAPSAAARPLDLLFARLAGTSGQAAPSQGPLSRWRRPS